MISCFILGLKPITTIAYVLTESYAEDLGLEINIIQILTVKNLESFFNFKTVGENYILVTTILSNSEKYINEEELSNLNNRIE